jgi:alpha-1,6-mannosyltransferase
VSASAPTRLWAWSGLGLAGSLLTALVAPRALHDGVVGWWFEPGFPGSGRAATTLVWVGMAVLAIAWLGVVREAHGNPSRLPVARATLIGALWAVPLALGPPLFSRDVYSYLAQGTILHLGHNPYHQAPVALIALHHRHTLDAVSPFWRHTTAPYGPLFLELISLIVGITGQHLIGGVLLCRVLNLIGLALVAVHVPRIARSLNASGGTGVWLAAASPLVLLGLVSAVHNDALMAGLLAAGVSVALRGNPLLGVAICALAATIKVPALVGAVFIAVCWARAEPRPAARARLLVASAGLTVAVLTIVTLASGVGLGWLSATVFSTPAKVHLAITPGTALGYTVAALLHAAGAGSVSTRGLESAFGVVVTVIAGGAGLALLWRARVPDMTALLGTTLLLAAAGGPAAWPWYLTWGLVLLCASPPVQRSPAILVPLVAGAFLVKPDGILILPVQASPAVLAVYVVAAGAAVAWWRRRRRGRAGAASRPSLPSTLVRT